MTACAMRTVLILLFLSIVLGSSAFAETMTMTLEGVTANTCDTVWMEGSCALRVIDTTIGDYTPPGNCVFFPQSEGIALMGARLEIDVSGVRGVEVVEVDLREVSGDSRTRVFVFEEGAANYFNFAMSWYHDEPTDQTIPLFTAGFSLAKIAISGHEALIQEVRLVGKVLVDLEDPSWGMLKAAW